MEIQEVDGSFGEGGGQILRTATAFSIITGRPIHVTSIRAGRQVPGLRPQHLAAVRILRDISGGRLEGANVGSGEITFLPGEVREGSLEVNLKTAASITLVLQAVVPAVSLTGSRLRLDLIGGTDVPWSPPIDYFSAVVREGFRRAGINFSVAISKRGYYPRGGGRVTSLIEPCMGVNPIRIVDPAVDHPVSIVSRCGMLPRHVAERQSRAATKVLEERGLQVGEVTETVEMSDSPGSSIVLTEISSGRILGTDSLGARRTRAEDVGKEAAESLVSVRESGSCLDPFLADMLAPLLCFARQESRVRIPGVTKHLATSLHVASLFTDFEYSIEDTGTSKVLTIRPGGASSV